MELKPGYKLTEAGIIPENWTVAALGESLATRPDYGINAPAVAYSDRLPAYIRITDITNEGRLNAGERVSVNSTLAENYYLQDGDIVLARTGASVGKSYRYKPSDGPLVYAGFLIRIRPNPERLLPEFTAAYLSTHGYWRWVRLMSMRSGQPGINGSEYGSLPIALPPVHEQRAIAEALSDVDALLAETDRLIAKKRGIKQAVTQQIFARHSRLPGFCADWKPKRLGQLGSFLKGSGVKKNEAMSGSLPCVRYGEIYTRHADCIRQFYSWISPAVAATATRLRPGDLLFAGSGETKEEIGKCVAFVDPVEAYAGGDIVILRLDGANAMFLGYYCNTPPINARKAGRAQGDAVVHISADALADIEVMIPEPAEQAAIAAVLSDMDTELAALEARRAKTLAIKQAMMQELLTGKTRLVPAGDTHA